MNKRMQITLYSSLAFAVLVICALLPRIVVPAGQPEGQEAPEPLSLSEKTALFLLHWTGSGPGAGAGFTVENTDREEMPENSVLQCAAVRDRLLDGFAPDEAENGYEISGEQFYALSLANDPGRQMRLYHVWYQWTGNRQNWFNLCVDADTGVIYYFYISSGVSAGYAADFSLVPDGFVLKPEADARTIAYLWPAYCRFECVSAVPSGRYNDDLTPIYTAVYTSGADVLSYDISCKYYPQILLDIKLSVIETVM